MVATYEEVQQGWTARDTLNFLLKNKVDPHQSYSTRCRSTLCKAGLGLAASRLHDNDLRRAAKGYKVKSPTWPKQVNYGWSNGVNIVTRSLR